MDWRGLKPETSAPVSLPGYEAAILLTDQVPPISPTPAETPTPASPAPTPISITDLSLCAQNRQREGCPYEQVIVERYFEGGTLSLTGSMFRDSGDAQLNEHAQIWVDDQQVFASYDRPGRGETEPFGPVLVHVEPGAHRVVVRHGDDSEKPKSAGSIDIQIALAFLMDPLTPTPMLTPSPTATPTAAETPIPAAASSHTLDATPVESPTPTPIP